MTIVSEVINSLSPFSFVPQPRVIKRVIAPMMIRAPRKYNTFSRVIFDVTLRTNIFTGPAACDKKFQYNMFVKLKASNVVGVPFRAPSSATARLAIAWRGIDQRKC